MSALPASPPQRIYYDYRTADGKLAYQVVREQLPEGRKTFKQRRPDGYGDWIWNLNGVEPIPYELPDVLRTIAAGGIIFIVEGEKAADDLNQALRKAGINAYATCNNGGAGKWGDAQSKYLVGATVILLPDNDVPGFDINQPASLSRKSPDFNPGAAHIQIAGCALLAAGVASLRMIELPGLPAKGDWYDWHRLGEGHDIPNLLSLAEKASDYTPPTVPAPTPTRSAPTKAVLSAKVSDLDRRQQARLKGWARSALESITADLARLDDGRHDAIRTGATRLGSIAAQGLLTDSDCLNALHDALAQTGSTKRKKEIDWYFKKGKQYPCELPDLSDEPANEGCTPPKLSLTYKTDLSPAAAEDSAHDPSLAPIGSKGTESSAPVENSTPAPRELDRAKTPISKKLRIGKKPISPINQYPAAPTLAVGGTLTQGAIRLVRWALEDGALLALWLIAYGGQLFEGAQIDTETLITEASKLGWLLNERTARRYLRSLEGTFLIRTDFYPSIDHSKNKGKKLSVNAPAVLPKRYTMTLDRGYSLCLDRARFRLFEHFNPATPDKPLPEISRAMLRNDFDDVAAQDIANELRIAFSDIYNGEVETDPRPGQRARKLSALQAKRAKDAHHELQRDIEAAEPLAVPHDCAIKDERDLIVALAFTYAKQDAARHANRQAQFSLSDLVGLFNVSRPTARKIQGSLGTVLPDKRFVSISSVANIPFAARENGGMVIGLVCVFPDGTEQIRKLGNPALAVRIAKGIEVKGGKVSAAIINRPNQITLAAKPTMSEGKVRVRTAEPPLGEQADAANGAPAPEQGDPEIKPNKFRAFRPHKYYGPGHNEEYTLAVAGAALAKLDRRVGEPERAINSRGELVFRSTGYIVDAAPDAKSILTLICDHLPANSKLSSRLSPCMDISTNSADWGTSLVTFESFEEDEVNMNHVDQAQPPLAPTPTPSARPSGDLVAVLQLAEASRSNAPQPELYDGLSRIEYLQRQAWQEHKAEGFTHVG